jgi:hypothetical protein
MSTKSRTAQQDLARKVLVATVNNLPPQTSVTLAGTQYTRDTLAASVQQDIDTADAATNASKAFINAAAAARERRAARKPFYKGLQAYVENLFTDPNVVAEFGFHSRKPTTPSTKTKVAAAQKRAATREARHTMGQNQKKLVKGDVIGVTVTPIMAPPAIVSTPVSPGPTPPTPATPATSGGAPAPKPTG